MKTITCPTCNLEHGLFWSVDSEGEKSLSYRCNKVERFVHVKNWNDPQLKTFTEVRTVYDKKVLLGAVGEDLPEEWCRAWRDKQQGQKQYQLILMNKR